MASGTSSGSIDRWYSYDDDDDDYDDVGSGSNNDLSTLF